MELLKTQKLPVEICLYIEEYKQKFELHDRLLKAQQHLELHFIRFPFIPVQNDSWQSFMSSFNENIMINNTQPSYKTKSGNKIKYNDSLIEIRKRQKNNMTIIEKMYIISSDGLNIYGYSYFDPNVLRLLKEIYSLTITVLFLYHFLKKK
jgi:hypothetical protein